MWNCRAIVVIDIAHTGGGGMGAQFKDRVGRGTLCALSGLTAVRPFIVSLTYKSYFSHPGVIFSVCGAMILCTRTDMVRVFFNFRKSVSVCVCFFFFFFRGCYCLPNFFPRIIIAKTKSISSPQCMYE
ncbi:hypothetical protein QBC42DRAFT_111130 [Cladorrhinum samala]|uniref:Uncharacterized protein n=1 Tax=Cladorrhinum samala TaxID=585594 RepID=A0AAV9HGF7_9PEZI|nr:hypothetical protein QBC42DRAFT_111130 [Cladorrhinum samala]